MVKAITFPLQMVSITDHAPYWKQGETVKFTIFVDDTVWHTVDLTVAYVGMPHPNPRHDYLLWCRDTDNRECTIDLRAFIGLDITYEEASRASGRLETCTE